MNYVPKISIIIANYNNGHYFEAAYRSLMNQSSVDWEAVVIDDASTDNSANTIEKLITGDSRFRFFQNERNLGYQKTVMRGIELSAADIFGRLDPDDALYPEAICLSVAEHEQNPEVGLVYTDITVCDKNLKPLYDHQSTQINALDETYYLLAGEIGAFATFKKNIYSRTGGIDPFIKRAEDMDIYMRMCEIAPVKRIAQPLYYYRFHNSSLSKMDNADKAFFWHWAALVKMSERRGINIEEAFIQHIASRKELNHYKERVAAVKSFILRNRLFSFVAKINPRLGFRNLK